MANTSKNETIIPVPFSSALGERYLAYAMSTIVSRSLPDVRDGLKPVHRRLLYAMLQLKLDPASGFKKCARVVGDVIGKYHPHGDTAVYDAMVRLAQSFSLRYPLVEGQGNFGSIDGDNAAAMRYTEAKLTPIALALLQDIKNDTVNFRPTYDGSEEEPVVLPAAFPNLLANGSEGIAVGMATSIPPHNLEELCNALLHLIKSPNSSAAKLMDFVQGPDFPTGGVIVESRESLVQTYSTGRGTIRIRAKWQKEDLGHGQYQIVITEIPYQVQKSKLIEKIADAFKAKKLALMGNIRDESAEDIRVVIEPKSRTVDAEMLMESLFKLTDLETRFNLNMNVITKSNHPKVMDLAEVLRAFLEHRNEILVRRSHFRLDKINHRLEVLDGLLIAYLNIDEVIRIIREEDDPKEEMMKRWKLTDIQAESILNMRLRSLRRLEEFEIKSEHDKLSEEKAGLQHLLADESEQWKTIADEIKEIKKQFGSKTEIGARRTEFGDTPTADIISIEAFVEKEPITVVLTQKGWIKALKTHAIKPEEIKYKDGDAGHFLLKAHTTDRLIVFASDGKSYTIASDKLSGGKGDGDPIRVHVDIPADAIPIALFAYQEGKQALIISNQAKGFLIATEDLLSQTKNGKQILTLGKGARAHSCLMASSDSDSVAMIGLNRKMVILPLSEIPQMKKGSGVKLQSFKQGGLSDAKIFKQSDGLTWQLGERNRLETDLLPWLSKRGAAGRLPPNGFPRTNRFDS